MILSERVLKKIVKQLLVESFGRQTWEAMAKAASVSPDEARTVVEKFRQLRDQRRISTEKQGQMADITWWLGQVGRGGMPEFERLENFVRSLGWKKFKRPSALQDQDIINLGEVQARDGKRYRVRIPLSEEKSCVVGHGTKQCIAADENNAFFRYFIDEGWTVFYIQRVGSGPKQSDEHQGLLSLYRTDRGEAIRGTHAYTLLLDGEGRLEAWTAENFHITAEEFEEATGLQIYWFEDKMNSYSEVIEDARQALREEYGMDEDDYYR